MTTRERRCARHGVTGDGARRSQVLGCPFETLTGRGNKIPDERFHIGHRLTMGGAKAGFGVLIYAIARAKTQADLAKGIGLEQVPVPATA